MKNRTPLLVVILIIALLISFTVGTNIGNRINVDSKYREVTRVLNEYNEGHYIINRFTEDDVRDDSIMLDFVSKLEDEKTINDVVGILSNNTKSVFHAQKEIKETLQEGEIDKLKRSTVKVKKLSRSNLNLIKYFNIFILSFIVALIFSQLESKYIVPTIIAMGLIGIVIYINLI